jgi:isoleucyl-tRNA synthetase
LCKILSPILAFSADEAWEFVPATALDSVHLAEWSKPAFELPPAEQATWKSLFELRNLALPELEKARQAKTIGKSLDAKLLVSVASPAATEAKNHREILRELLNVSQLDFAAGNEAFTVTKADGQKCERCWHWETDINPNSPEHPTICGRCITAVKANQ